MAGRTLLQFFHWYYPDGGQLWDEVAQKAEDLKELGVTDVWLPPAYKGAAGGYSVGYDSYDLFDLGEFDQKGSIATKYGDRAALERAAHALHDVGLGVIHDVVFNHKMGADEMETVHVRRANPDNRDEVEDQAFQARAWTRYVFPGRQGRYSEFVWDARCFTGVDHIEEPDEDGVFRLVNEYGDGEWNIEVDDEKGNFDYLMGSDVEFRNRAVYEELKYWGRWLADQLPCDGFRLDAAKHIPAWFFRDWVGHMRESVGDALFVVAEYWHPDMTVLQAYLDMVDRQLMLFDVGLLHRFHDAARAGGDFDLRTIFDGSLLHAAPDHAVTIVGNHDTQPLQALEAPVEDWFKPPAGQGSGRCLRRSCWLKTSSWLPSMYRTSLKLRAFRSTAPTSLLRMLSRRSLRNCRPALCSTCVCRMARSFRRLICSKKRAFQSYSIPGMPTPRISSGAIPRLRCARSPVRPRP